MRQCMPNYQPALLVAPQGFHHQVQQQAHLDAPAAWSTGPLQKFLLALQHISQQADKAC